MNPVRLALGQSRNSLLATAAYAAALALLLIVGASACAALWQSWSNYSSAAENLEQLRARKGLAGLRFTTQPPAGSAYIEGQTATVAGAALQQRIGAVLSEAGGSVLSSELDLHEAGAEGGRVALVVACDIDQPGLQRALYEIEAGMPVLMVDRLTAQTAGGDEKSAAPRLRAQIAVSGQWRATP
ncbi:MAG TPA: type II secretion system protein GspM [Rhodoblastus sp.]|nr:type II secretion system protein GspM [Rhodoblastus sp.]